MLLLMSLSFITVGIGQQYRYSLHVLWRRFTQLTRTTKCINSPLTEPDTSADLPNFCWGSFGDSKDSKDFGVFVQPFWDKDSKVVGKAGATALQLKHREYSGRGSSVVSVLHSPV